MIKDNRKFQKFEADLVAKEKTGFMKNYRIVEAMYDEAVALGIVPMKHPLDGIDIDIKIARVVNSVSNKNSTSDWKL